MNNNAAKLKTVARAHLAGRYGVFIVAYIFIRFICNIPSLVISSTINTGSLVGAIINFFVSLIVVFITAIFVVGYNYMCLSTIRTGGVIPVSYLWYGFKNKADEIIRVYFLYMVRILCAYIPLLIGVIAIVKNPTNTSYYWLFGIIILLCMINAMMISLDYALILYIVIDRSGAKASDILAESKALMIGHRLRLFKIYCSFIGMFLLVLLSFGVAMLWVYPYIRMTLTEFYLEATGQMQIYFIDESCHSRKPAEPLNTEDPDYYKEVIE